MALKKYKPVTPGMRQFVANVSETEKKSPERALTRGKKSSGGRNNQGRVTTRFRGGGVKRQYRTIDFFRNKDNIPASVAAIEYDPNRSANIALLHYADGEKRYILAPVNLKKGDKVLSGSGVGFDVGNSLPLGEIPAGVSVHCIEMQPGGGAKLVRGAGASAVLRAKEGKLCQLLMPSGEVRQLNVACRATIGRVGNIDHEDVNLGKAGRKRYAGKRPHVRGVVMNPVDHPHGGGEGKTSGGGDPVSPWSWHTKGHRTRNKRKSSSKFIVKRRDK